MTSIKLPDLNIVVVAGRLTHDPDVRSTSAGTQVCNLQVAISRRYKNKQGEWVDDPTFIGVVVWGDMAERCKDRLKKGSPVLINGSLRSRSWEKEGQKRNTIEISVNRIQFLEKLSLTEGKEVVEEVAEEKGAESDEIPF